MNMKLTNLNTLIDGAYILKLHKRLLEMKPEQNYTGETFTVDLGDGSEPFEVQISVCKPDRGPHELRAQAAADAGRYRKLKAKVQTQERDGGYRSFYQLPHVDRHLTAPSRKASFFHETLDEAVDALP